MNGCEEHGRHGHVFQVMFQLKRSLASIEDKHFSHEFFMDVCNGDKHILFQSQSPLTDFAPNADSAKHLGQLPTSMVGSPGAGEY